jgi:hypothetical protein
MVTPPSAIRGRVRVQVVTRAVLTAMENLYQDESDLYLDEVMTWLTFHHDIYISKSTLQRTLTEAGLTRKVLQKIASEWNEDLRQQFRDAIIDPDFFAGDGSEFVVLDETSKNERTWARTHGRSLSGKRAQLEDVFIRGDRFSLLAALTIEGYMAVRVVEGSFDAYEFWDFVQEEVVRVCTYLSVTLTAHEYPKLINMNPYPDARSVLIMDNCNIHHNDALVDLVHAAGMFLHLTSAEL